MSEKFTVTFYDDDRKTILETQQVDKGASVKYQGKIPEKSPENGIEYTFVGWETTGNLAMIMENTEVFAKYQAGTKTNSMYELSEANAEAANLNEVMQAGQKLSEVEKATRDLSLEQKSDLVNEIKEKSSVDLDRQTEQERD